MTAAQPAASYGAEDGRHMDILRLATAGSVRVGGARLS